MRPRLLVAAFMLVAFTLLIAPSRLLASEPGMHEERAGMCDGFEGLSFTFCVALCEARECDVRSPDDERCATLARGFARVSGGALAPCSLGTAGSSPSPEGL